MDEDIEPISRRFVRCERLYTNDLFKSYKLNLHLFRNIFQDRNKKRSLFSSQHFLTKTVIISIT